MRRAVLVMCDGLSRAWISPERTPNIWALKQRSLWASDHRAVFPSVTRACADAVATGHTPGNHVLCHQHAAADAGAAQVVAPLGVMLYAAARCPPLVCAHHVVWAHIPGRLHPCASVLWARRLARPRSQPPHDAGQD